MCSMLHAGEGIGGVPIKTSGRTGTTGQMPSYAQAKGLPVLFLGRPW